MGEMALLKYGLFAALGVGTATIGWSFVSTRSLSKLAKIFLSSFAGLAFVAVYSIYIEPNWIEVHQIKIHDAKLATVLKGTKIVHITDIHLNEGIGFRERRLVRKVNALKPDIIFITGDILDDITQMEPARKLIGSLKASTGIYGIAGDTDHIVMDGASLARELAPAGIDILVDEHRRISLSNGNFLWILGLDSKSNPRKISQLLAGIPDHVPPVFLAESPAVFEEAAEAGIRLVLVGDTHGGQVGIPFLIRLSDYANRSPYMKGLFTRDKTKMYVNRGVGTKTLPVRFLCRPEIAVIEVTE